MEEERFFLVDEYVTTKPGEPYRLFPFGAIFKGGKKRIIDAAYAAKFHLPHFKPPIKLGSHEETTPAGGQIIGLEVRADGLYAIPEMTEKGTKTVEEGDYRYHSPEVIWEGGGYEDPATGEIIPGPMIVGDALLHTPHLGEAAALYKVEILSKEVDTMSDETVNVPKNLWDKIMEKLDSLFAAKPVETEPEPEPETAPAADTERFTALETERDQYKAQLEALQMKQTKKDQLSALVQELQSEKFGSMYVELKSAEEAAGMMAGMTPEQREWCMRTFSAHAAQIQTGELYSEKGSNQPGTSDDPMLALDAAIKAKAAEKKIGYHEAFAMVQVEHPELFTAAYSKGGK